MSIFNKIAIAALSTGAAFILQAIDQPYNPGFEANPKNAEGWSGFTLSSTQPRSGRFCAYLTGKFGNGWNLARNRTNLTCEPETWYRIKVWVRGNHKDGVIYLGAREIADVAKDKTLRYFWKELPEVTSEWKQYQAVFKTHSTAKIFQVYVKLSAASTGGQVFWDDFTVEIAEKPETLSFGKYPASVTWVDRDNLIADHVNDKLTKLDPAEPLRVCFRNVPAGSELVLTFNGRKIRRKLAGSKEEAFDLQWSKLPEGRYIVSAELFDKSGKCIDRAEHTVLRMKAPEVFKAEPVKKVTAGPGRMFHVNGKPFFPVCFCHIPQEERTYRELKENFGLNTTFVWGSASGSTSEERASSYIRQITRLLDNCKRSGVYAIVVLEGLEPHRGRKGFDLKAMRMVIDGLKNHPSVLIWRLKDEPDGSGRLDKDALLKAYQTIREADPDHPVVTNFCNEQVFPQYAATSDFGSFDHYPYPATSMLAMREFSRFLKSFYAADKPLINYMQFWGEGEKIMTMPPWQWLKANFYLALTEGTKSLFVYAWNDPKPNECLCRDMESQGYLKALATKFMDMREFLTVPAEKTSFSLPDFAGARINRLGLLLVNPSDTPRSVSLPLKQEKLIDEYGNTLAPDKNGMFTLELIPYHAMFYRFK